jgi:hypothetical protein
LDWENAIAGDPLFELAGLAAFKANELVEPLLEHYHFRPPDIKRRFWIYYLRIALARTVHRARVKLPENPVYPRASMRIQLALSNLE